MSVARLTALRLVGFKSFAERTTVEFGPGISAVVGPNGSGKSNLADALRWTLGEQGRTLRTKRSEDVIFAGSSTRRAIGMADVTLVIDNHDRLLPVEYGEVEIGRRLYRSGENEYLLNRQRIRLRDLVELLDAGNIADNAFLFIGQGMVDQALALRPEERRPLFEEAAGVRRHERRRRQAESELAEAEVNLDRLRDLLAELRPQARRLAAQAEQLQARRTAGVELAEGLLVAARARWATASELAAREQKTVDRARAAADAALADLKQAEETASEVSGQIGERAESERDRRQGLDRKRAEIVELRVSLARVESETSAVERDRARLTAELAEAERRLAAASSTLAAPGPERDSVAAAEIELVERQLRALEEVVDSGFGQAKGGAGDDTARALASRRADHTANEQRMAANRRSVGEADARVQRLAAELAEAGRARDEAVERLGDAAGAETVAGQAAETQRIAFERASTERSAAHMALSEEEAAAAGARARLAAIDAALEVLNDPSLGRAARARGGRLMGEGLEVDPRLRGAVGAALGEAAGAYAVDEAAVVDLAARRGYLAIGRARSRRDSRSAAAAEQIVTTARALGGGPLTDAIRSDPQGHVSALLERVVWLPDLRSALAIRTSLGPGWYAVTLAGEIVSDQGIVAVGHDRSAFDLPARRSAEEERLAEAEARIAKRRTELDRAVQTAADETAGLREAENTLQAARADHRRAAEAERLAQRRAEQLVREHAWESSQLERLRNETTALANMTLRLDETISRLETEQAAATPAGKKEQDRRRQVADLRSRRDLLLGARQADEARVAASEESRRRADISRALDQARLRELDVESERITGREAELAARRTTLAEQLTRADALGAVLAAALEEVLAAGADDRERLIAAERAAGDARERLRTSADARRDAEMRAMEARLQAEQVREQLLVELASIGPDGLTTLVAAAGEVGELQPDEGNVEQMEELLDHVITRWSGGAASAEAPSQGRLSVLRRKFHELGVGNPFASEEYAELRDRLETLEGQRVDMEAAITATRDLIASLSALINDQFRSTFAALEDAFARRFHELFGGGEAQLSLTAPDDLSVTGIEIHARPPGKKRQPLSMLSGGERALTAVSLLMAMLEVRPVPFCVLDEVDAALDEANVTRFSKALRGLAKQTQFIVITHNRGTIEAADALYGVTLGDDAVSRVISLRLPEAVAAS